MKTEFGAGDLVIPIKPKEGKMRLFSWVDSMDDFEGKLCEISDIYPTRDGVYYICHMKDEVSRELYFHEFYFHESWLIPPAKEFNFSPNKELSSLLKRVEHEK